MDLMKKKQQQQKLYDNIPIEKLNKIIKFLN